MKTYTYLVTLRCFEENKPESMVEVTHWDKKKKMNARLWVKDFIKEKKLEAAYILNIEYLGMRAR